MTEKEKGQVSDTYHTFDELYYVKGIMFVSILMSNPDISWRTRKHHDEVINPMYHGMFLAGINTKEGQFTFHLEEEMWEKLNSINTIECSPVYDGHTTMDVTRLLSI